MANKFEQMASMNNEYGQTREPEKPLKEKEIKNFGYGKVIKTGFSLQNDNMDKLDVLVDKMNAKSRSQVVNYLIEAYYNQYVG